MGSHTLSRSRSIISFLRYDRSLHHKQFSNPCRPISSTPTYFGWFDKIKGLFTGQKPSLGSQVPSLEEFTLLNYADQLQKARKLGSFKNSVLRRSSGSASSDVFEKNEAILRYLGSCDLSGEHLETSQKNSAAQHCNCTTADVEHALSKYSRAKEIHKRLNKLKQEGRPMPKTSEEVGKLVLDIARFNLAKRGQMSMNLLCSCGSKKTYERKKQYNVNSDLRFSRGFGSLKDASFACSRPFTNNQTRSWTLVLWNGHQRLITSKFRAHDLVIFLQVQQQHYVLILSSLFLRCKSSLDKESELASLSAEESCFFSKYDSYNLIMFLYATNTIREVQLITVNSTSGSTYNCILCMLFPNKAETMICK